MYAYAKLVILEIFQPIYVVNVLQIVKVVIAKDALSVILQNICLKMSKKLFNF
jgi:hypothetical protein